MAIIQFINNNGKYEANLIAKYIIYKCTGNKETVVTQKKLHKLMYFVYQWYLYVHNQDENHIKNRLFKNTFQAWVHGPVLKEIYPLYANYWVGNIEIEEFDTGLIDREITKEIDKVLGIYNKYTANELEELSHYELSWIKAREGIGAYDPCTNSLSDKLIYIEA